MLEERYWDRTQWNIELQVLMNPFCSAPDDTDSEMRAIFEQPAIDATTDSGLAHMASKMGIKIKSR